MPAIQGFLDIQKTSGTAYAYRAALFSFLSYVHGGLEWDKHGATPAQVQKFEQLAEQYIAECKRKKNPRDPYQDLIGFAVSMNGEIAPKTINVKVSGIREWLSHNRVELKTGDMKRIRRKMPRVRAVSEETVLTREILQQLLNNLDIRGRALLLFLASSGCRIGETLLLKEIDFDLESHPARVHIPADITKTDQPRTVFISDEAREALKTFLAVRGQYIATKHKRSGSDNAKSNVGNSDPYLFGIRVTSTREIWDRACKKVMIPDGNGGVVSLFQRDSRTGHTKARIHALRKFFRSNMALSMPDGAIEKLLGHEAGLQGIYSRYTDEQMAELYLRGMDAVTINTGDPFVKEKIQTLAEENQELKKRLNEIETKQSLETAELLAKLEQENRQMQEKIAAIEAHAQKQLNDALTNLVGAIVANRAKAD